MVTSIGVIIVLGLLANAFLTKLRLPGLLGMIFVGVLMGPFVLDYLDDSLMMVSGDFRKIALIIILLRAGLGISKEALHKVGRPALIMSFLPGILEGFSIAFLSMYFFDMSFIEGGILGFVIAAVSPAVVVPKMIEYAEEGRGAEKGIPTMILASASVDDVFAITIFSAFLGLYSGNQMTIGYEILNVPISIVLGIVIGSIIGLILIKMFEWFPMRDTKKILYVLGAAILITGLESLLHNTIEIAGLLGVMAIGFVILEKRPNTGRKMAKKLGKIWIFAELLLFVLVGAQVNIHVALDAGFRGLLLICFGLIARSVGVFIATLGTSFSLKERLFCVVAYIPKATVQAAIGGIPLALGVAQGELILALAVLSILVTAPLGAIAIHVAGQKWLNIEV